MAKAEGGGVAKAEGGGVAGTVLLLWIGGARGRMLVSVITGSECGKNSVMGSGSALRIRGCQDSCNTSASLYFMSA